MGFLDRFRRKRGSPSSTSGPSGESRADLEEFMASRQGVEAYIEPPTPVYSMTLCLVAHDGEHIRRPVKDDKQARNLATEHGVPFYDARLVGYPKRMRDYEHGMPHQRIDLDDLPPLDVADGGSDSGSGADRPPESRDD